MLFRSVIKYEAALKADKYLLVVHGSPEELAQARAVLMGSKTLATA